MARATGYAPDLEKQAKKYGLLRKDTMTPLDNPASLMDFDAITTNAPASMLQQWLDDFVVGDPIKTWCKPSLTIQDGWYAIKDNYEVRFAFSVPDAYHSGRSIPLMIARPVPEACKENRALFYKWLRVGLMDMLKHELDEAIEVNGKKIYDPHSPRFRLPEETI